jgi:hypothetical protein
MVVCDGEVLIFLYIPVQNLDCRFGGKVHYRKLQKRLSKFLIVSRVDRKPTTPQPVLPSLFASINISVNFTTLVANLFPSLGS